MACRRSHHNGEDVPGLFTTMPSHLFVYPLPGTSRQPRRTHLEVIPGQSRARLFVQFSGECWLRPSRRESSINRTACSSRHILRMLQNNIRLEIWARVRVKSKIQGGQIYNRIGAHDQRERMGWFRKSKIVFIITLKIAFMKMLTYSVSCYRCKNKKKITLVALTAKNKIPSTNFKRHVDIYNQMNIYIFVT